MSNSTYKWKSKKLGEVISLQRGHDLTNSERIQGDVPVYGAAGHNGFHNKALVKGPGIVVGRSGGSFGQVHLVKKDFWPHNTAMYVTDFKGNDPFFIYYLLKLLDFDSLNSGSAQPSLNRNFLYPVSVNIPANTCQIEIANVLSSLDSKIELNNRINAELEQMAKTIYDYWFVQFDFPISAEYSAAVGQPELEGKPYKSSGGKMVWSEELKREVPDGWEVKSIGELGEISGGSTPSREINEYFTKNGIPWITPKDLSLNTGNKFITKGELDVSEQGLKSASLNVMPKGTVLLSSRAPIGYIAISREKVTTNQGFKSFTPTKGYTSEFIFYTLIHMLPTIENNAAGSTFKEVSTSTLKSIKTYLPLSELVFKFTAKVKPIFERQDLLELENQKLTEFRDWLLPMLMNGQVRVGDEEMMGR